MHQLVVNYTNWCFLMSGYFLLILSKNFLIKIEKFSNKSIDML